MSNLGDTIYNNQNEFILRYLSGNASEQEVHELETWVQADADHKAYFVSIKKTWDTSSAIRDDNEIDVQTAYNDISKKLFASTPVKPITFINRRKWMSIAASLLLLVAAVFLFNRISGDTNNFIARSSPKDIILSDGTLVTLNSGTELYTQFSDKDDRQVRLEGDAYFDVARDVSRPFIISADDVVVEVLGTAFYVDARKKENIIKVTVASGRVAVRFGKKTVELGPQDVAFFNKDDQILTKSTNTDINFNSIKTNRLVFKNTELFDVVQTLNRHFNANIIFDNSNLETCPLTSTFEDKSLDSILQIIKSSLGIDYRKNKNQIILEGSCTLK